ncbi:TIGR04222 domain-containing membrane protein [Actinomadura sp. 9N407]|uniref:TIGR04222 domain-containing membrane protein n=1 Tax=Actinomadura sp. 9N407 TaxID=3375154 RepID=UPI0037B189FD
MQIGAWELSAWGAFAGFILIGLVLLALLWSVRKRVREGTPATRDLHPYEVAYLHGGGRHAIAASLTALRLDGAIDAYAHGRFRATGPTANGPRAARMPLDGAIYGAIVGGRAATLARLTAEPGIRAMIEKLRAGLADQGLLIGPGARRRFTATAWVVRGWAVLGAVVSFVTGGFEDSMAGLATFMTTGALLVASAALGAGKERTREGERALDRVREGNTRLDPVYAPPYAQLGAPEVLLGVALFGTAALMALDPVFAQTVGLGRYLQLTGVSGTSGGYAGPACSTGTSVCSSGSCGGGGACGGGGGSGSGGGGGGCGGGGGGGGGCGGGGG